jgi:hypothetical protein
MRIWLPGMSAIIGNTLNSSRAVPASIAQARNVGRLNRASLSSWAGGGEVVMISD